MVAQIKGVTGSVRRRLITVFFRCQDRTLAELSQRSPETLSDRRITHEVFSTLSRNDSTDPGRFQLARGRSIGRLRGPLQGLENVENHPDYHAGRHAWHAF